MTSWLLTIITVLLAAWLARRLNRRAANRPPGATADGGVVLVYPGWWRWASWVFLLAGSAMLALLWSKAPPVTPADRVGLALLLAGFVGGGIAAVLETHRLRVVLTDRGITARTPWGGSRAICWGQVHTVDFQLPAQWFRVWDRHRVRVRIPLPLVGIDHLETALARHLPADRYRRVREVFSTLREAD